MSTQTDRAEILLLSIVNDGASYEWRRRLATDLAANPDWRYVIRTIATRENHTLETDWSEADIAACAPLLANYMREHMAEGAAPATLHIEGRRWFQPSYGNTYHSVRIHENGSLIATIHAYGYGDQYLQTALDWLKATHRVPVDAAYGTLYLREALGATYSVADVNRKRDL